MWEYLYLFQSILFEVICLPCTNCGTEQKEDATFCHACGMPISALDASEHAAASVEPISTDASTKPTSPSATLGKPTTPEFALLWSLWLPLIGSIFWTYNWIQIGKKKHIWWTWVSVVAVLLLIMYDVQLFGNKWAGDSGSLVWSLTLYGLQRRAIPKKKNSKLARIISVILAGIILSNALISTTSNKGISPTHAPFITVGTSYDKNIRSLPVMGNDLRVDETLYVRLDAPEMSDKTSFIIILQQQEGNGWKTLTHKTMNVKPHFQVHVFPITLADAGTYKITFLDGNRLIATQTFQVHN